MKQFSVITDGRAQVLFRQNQEILSRLGQPLLEVKNYTPAEMECIQATLLPQYRQHPSSKTAFYPYGVDERVRLALNYASSSGFKVRIWEGDPETGKPWDSEFDVIGRVSVSMGPIRTPILLHRSSSMGGGSILTSCIVRIDNCETRRTLYKHPNFELPDYQVCAAAETAEYPFTVFKNKCTEVCARFKSEMSALRWVGFMTGTRYAK